MECCEFVIVQDSCFGEASDFSHFGQVRNSSGFWSHAIQIKTFAKDGRKKYKTLDNKLIIKDNYRLLQHLHLMSETVI